ncbi:MAG: hypothetical protein Q8O22_01040 [Candidatus Omnitrophota bacterium]|nr:hypothetical protein [Candidatus Omnitrophota bacterium]
MHKINRLNPDAGYQSDEYYKQLYGKSAIITRLGNITIVHLDRPNKNKIQQRKEEIIHEELNGEAFFDDCPLCQAMKKHPYDVVYYAQD